MSAKKQAKPQPKREATPSTPPETNTGMSQGLLSDLRGILVPSARSHYWFHVAVVLMSLSYWIGSLVLLPDASWAEIAMYRPKGDNQIFPAVTALSELNFGDPTDAVAHGHGVSGLQVVILFPYALAFAVFGASGYMVADALLSWIFFVAITLLLRRVGAAPVASLWLGSVISTGALQPLIQAINGVVGNLLALFGRAMVEWDFPSLIGLPFHDKRIPRPMITEIVLVLLLYFLFRQWRERGTPSSRRGIAIGGLMALLAQGDPYSFSAAGLVLVAVVIVTVRSNGWTMPWRFAVGGLLGAAVGGSYFMFQMFHQDPEVAARVGLAPFPRSRILLLPGYAPWLRLLVIVAIAIAVAFLARRRAAQSAPAGGMAPADDTRPHATFAVALVAAGLLAQPVQLFLLGKGAQIFHYQYYTLPTFYGYALLLLLIQLVRLAPSTGSPPATPFLDRWARVTLASVGAAAFALLAANDAVAGISNPATSRSEVSPWAPLGAAYRAGFRDLDKQFRENPRLKQTRTFATFCHEANFLLTAFHGKRASLPDNAYSTLGDDELELRLCRFAALCRIAPDRFASLIMDTFNLNYWLGCAKYWCGQDHKFTVDSDYSAEQLARVAALGQQPPFNLALPRGEFDRLNAKYAAFLQEPADLEIHPDVLVFDAILQSQGFSPLPTFYEEFHRNEIFTIYLKIPQPGGSQPPQGLPNGPSIPRR